MIAEKNYKREKLIVKNKGEAMKEALKGRIDILKDVIEMIGSMISTVTVSAISTEVLRVISSEIVGGTGP